MRGTDHIDVGFICEFCILKYNLPESFDCSILENPTGYDCMTSLYEPLLMCHSEKYFNYMAQEEGTSIPNIETLQKIGHYNLYLLYSIIVLGGNPMVKS